jgi:hypothetical protein
MTETEEQVVHEFPKGEREVVRAVLSSFKGRRYCSLRVFYRGERNGDWLPSKKGLTLAVDHIPDLVRAIRKLEEATKQDGDGAAF